MDAGQSTPCRPDIIHRATRAELLCSDAWDGHACRDCWKEGKYHAHGSSGASVASLEAPPLGGRAAATPQLPGQQLPRCLLYGLCQDLLQQRQGPILARAVSRKPCCLHSQTVAVDCMFCDNHTPWCCICAGTLSLLCQNDIAIKYNPTSPKTRKGGKFHGLVQPRLRLTGHCNLTDVQFLA